MLTRPLGILAALILTFALAGCGEDEPDDVSATDDTSAEGAPSEEEPSDLPTEEEPSDLPTEEAPEGVPCEYVPDGRPDAAELPPSTATATGEVTVAIDSSLGPLELTLDAAAAPCTVGSFVSLAEQGFFDGTTCHRLTTQNIFVLQCGDPGNGPAGPGTGGPGYTIPDEFPQASAYGPGTLAMANTGQPGTGGSQFFIVYDGPETQLPPIYTIFGEVTTGLDLVSEAAAEGTVDGGADGPPAVPVGFESVTIG